MLVDLHAHAAPASGDAPMTLAELASAAGVLGLDAVALTDHGGGADYGLACALLAERGVKLVPGREVSTPLGHVLVLATDQEWLAGLPPRCELPLPDARHGPSALVWAHPAGWRVGGLMAPPDPSRGASHVHAVEVLNGERLWQDRGVALAASLCADLGLGACGGSDAHSVDAVGRCLTEIEGAVCAEDAIEGIVAGTTRPVLGAAWAQANGATYERADLAPYRW